MTTSDELGEHFEIFLDSHLIRRSIPILFGNATSVWWDNVSTPQKETQETIVLTAFQKAVDELSEILGRSTRACS